MESYPPKTSGRIKHLFLMEVKYYQHLLNFFLQHTLFSQPQCHLEEALIDSITASC